MIKILVLCLLATLGTMGGSSAPKSPEASPSSIQDTSDAAADTETSAEPKATAHAAPEATAHAAPEATAHAAPEATAHAAPEATAHAAPEATTHAAPKATTHAAPEATTHAAPEATTHAAPEATARSSSTTARPISTTTHPTTLRCHCTHGPNCHDGFCTVSKGFCVTMAENNTLAGSQSVGQNNTCRDSADLCNTTIIITLSGHHYWRSRITCCNSRDYCNDVSLEVPPAITTQSELECPSCFALDHSSCTPVDRKCTAFETKCIQVAGTVQNGNKTTTFAGQGCATPSAQRIRSGVTLVFGEATYHFTRSTITGGASQIPVSVPFIFLLSSFVGLLQARLIY